MASDGNAVIGRKNDVRVCQNTVSGIAVIVRIFEPRQHTSDLLVNPIDAGEMAPNLIAHDRFRSVLEDALGGLLVSHGQMAIVKGVSREGVRST